MNTETSTWQLIVPFGEFSHPSGVQQVLDEAAIAAMAQTFDTSRKTLVDFDHYSDLSQGQLSTLEANGIQLPSDAAGWLVAVEPRADGLWGRIEWTPNGNKALLNSVYRFLSPVWLRDDCEDLGGGRLRPRALAKVGLTNEPNIRAIPALLNRLGIQRLAGPQILLNSALAAAPADSGMEDPAKPGRKESGMDFKQELLALLGLPAEASDEEIQTACAAKKQEMEQAAAEKAELTAQNAELANRAAAAQAELARRDKAALEAAVEVDLEQFKPVIQNRDEVKAQLLADRPGTLKVLMALKAPEGNEPLRNRREAKPPEPHAEMSPSDLARKRGELVNRVSQEGAWPTYEAARAEAARRDPELFRD